MSQSTAPRPARKPSRMRPPLQPSEVRPDGAVPALPLKPPVAPRRRAAHLCFLTRRARLTEAGCPVDLEPVRLRRAAGLINRAVKVLTYAGGAYCRTSKTAAREMLKTLRRRGKRTVELCCPFRDGVLMIG